MNDTLVIFSSMSLLYLIMIERYFIRNFLRKEKECFCAFIYSLRHFLYIISFKFGAFQIFQPSGARVLNFIRGFHLFLVIVDHEPQPIIQLLYDVYSTKQSSYYDPLILFQLPVYYTPATSHLYFLNAKFFSSELHQAFDIFSYANVNMLSDIFSSDITGKKG